MSKTRLSFSSLSLKWFLLGFDTLTIMHTNSSFFLSDLHFCLLRLVVRKMTTLNETTTLMKNATLTTTKRKRKRTRKFDDDDASSLQKPNANNAKRMKMKNDEKEETKTNLLGILVEATDCASPLVQIKTTKKDDESTPPPLPFPSRNPPPLETDKNDDDDENFELENIQNSKIEEEDQKEAKRRSNAQQPDEEEKEELKEEEEETTFTTTKTSSIIDDEATTAIESIAKAAPKQGLKMFVQWLDALVFDLKSRAATLKRSKKRAQKAFLRMQKEEKKKYGFSLESASAKTKGTKKIKKNIKSTRDLKMLRALEDFWGVELSETEKSLERARATLKAHTLMLAVEKDDEKPSSLPPWRFIERRLV